MGLLLTIQHCQSTTAAATAAAAAVSTAATTTATTTATNPTTLTEIIFLKNVL